MKAKENSATVVSTVSAHWTVRDSGTTTPPTSDDYSTWTVEKLRKECTSRKLRLSRKTSTVDRVKHLREFDAVHLQVVGAVLGSSISPSPTASLQTKNCVFRLLNILFSDDLAPRFAELGNTPTWQQLDVGDVNGSSSFWRDVVLENNTNRADYNELLSMNACFAGIDPSQIVIHDVATLFEMWKTLNRKYVKVLSLFTKSGQQEEDFFGYCGGSIDMYYLRECLHLKPDLTQFVEGGMLEAGEFDSLKRTAENQLMQQSTPSKKLKCELIESVKTLTAKLEPAGSSAIEQILKMHQLVEHVEDRIATKRTKGESTEMLEVSLELYSRKLRELESALVNSK